MIAVHVDVSHLIGREVQANGGKVVGAVASVGDGFAPDVMLILELSNGRLIKSRLEGTPLEPEVKS